LPRVRLLRAPRELQRAHVADDRRHHAVQGV
jgi:hypothetical protein